MSCSFSWRNAIRSRLLIFSRSAGGTGDKGNQHQTFVSSHWESVAGCGTYTSGSSTCSGRGSDPDRRVCGTCGLRGASGRSTCAGWLSSARCCFWMWGIWQCSHSYTGPHCHCCGLQRHPEETRGKHWSTRTQKLSLHGALNILHLPCGKQKAKCRVSQTGVCANNNS